MPPVAYDTLENKFQELLIFFIMIIVLIHCTPVTSYLVFMLSYINVNLKSACMRCIQFIWRAEKCASPGSTLGEQSTIRNVLRNCYRFYL